VRENIEIPIETVTLADGLVWEDDWFAVCALDESTLAIGEPAYHQRNWSYLISDAQESLLFDTGSGRRPIAPLVARHGREAVTAFPSHMHFDHLGGVHDFGPVMVADLPMLRAVETGGNLTPTDDMFLGASEAVPVPAFEVGQWVKPGEVVTVGSRRLEVIHTPGHSPDSVSLWEAERARFYAADFIYRGALYAQTPGASLTQYIAVCQQLLEKLPENVEIVCAHSRPENGIDDAPILGYRDLSDLRDVLVKLLKHERPHIGEIPVNERMYLMYSVESFWS
jgi:glyoxylase-like metal-dependent hydrolase (beta-lactamase superfamily II)